MRKDTLYVQGQLSDQGLFKNNRTLVFIEKNKPVEYGPNQVQEYGFMKGDVYISRKLPGEQNLYFLLRLVNGERSLYELREKRGSRFFIGHDSSLTEIKKGAPLEPQLSQQLEPCGSKEHISSLASYKKIALKRAVLYSNNCYTGLFPRIRKGVFAGYEFASQSLGSIDSHITLQASGSFPTFGLFLDVPFGMSPSWFLNVQATFQQSSFSGNQQVDASHGYDYQFSFTSISLPMLFKFRGTSRTWRPFVSIGPTPAFNTPQKNALLSTHTVGTTAFLNIGTWDAIKTFQISGTLSTGVEYSLTQFKAVSLEMRYKKLIDGQVGPSQSFTVIGSLYF
jgi:hypothetical protein